MQYRLDDGQIEVVDDAIAEILRRKSPGERFAMVASGWRMARGLVECSIRRNHPDWDDAGV